jgi:hypothetical protein
MQNTTHFFTAGLQSVDPEEVESVFSIFKMYVTTVPGV